MEIKVNFSVYVGGGGGGGGGSVAGALRQEQRSSRNIRHFKNANHAKEAFIYGNVIIARKRILGHYFLNICYSYLIFILCLRNLYNSNFKLGQIRCNKKIYANNYDGHKF